MKGKEFLSGNLKPYMDRPHGQKGEDMVYKGQVLQVDYDINRDGLQKLYPDGIIPKDDATNMLHSMVEGVRFRLENIGDELAKYNNLRWLSTGIIKPIIDKEFSELENGYIEHDLTLDQFEVVTRNLAEYLMKFADFLYSPPKYGVDWFDEFYRKYF